MFSFQSSKAHYDVTSLAVSVRGSDQSKLFLNAVSRIFPLSRPLQYLWNCVNTDHASQPRGNITVGYFGQSQRRLCSCRMVHSVSLFWAEYRHLTSGCWCFIYFVCLFVYVFCCFYGFFFSVQNIDCWCDQFDQP